MNRKALVTGCSGFIGSHLVEGLLEQGSGGKIAITKDKKIRNRDRDG